MGKEWHGILGAGILRFYTICIIYGANHIPHRLSVKIPVYAPSVVL